MCVSDHKHKGVVDTQTWTPRHMTEVCAHEHRETQEGINIRHAIHEAQMRSAGQMHLAGAPDTRIWPARRTPRHLLVSSGSLFSRLFFFASTSS